MSDSSVEDIFNAGFPWHTYCPVKREHNGNNCLTELLCVCWATSAEEWRLGEAGVQVQHFVVATLRTKTHCKSAGLSNSAIWAIF